MALQAEIIPFTIRTPAGAGTQTISHVRYPSIAAKAFIFVAASNSGTNSEIYSFGVDDGTTHIGTGLGTSDDPFNASGILSARGYSTQYSLVTEQAQVFFGGAQMRAAGYVSAIRVGEFDITWDINNTPGADWFAIMIGGDGVEAKVGLHDVSGGSGNVDVGFDPVAVFKLSTIDAGGTGDSANAYHSYGFAVPCNDNQVGWGASRAFAAASSFQLDGTLQVDIIPTATTISDSCPVSAWVTDGWTQTVAGAPDWNIGYLAIGGTAVSANLVAITQPTSTGLQQTTIDATDPVIVFFASTNKTATAGAGNVDANLSFGCYDGSSQMAQWWGNVSTAARVHDRISTTTKAILLATATGDSTAAENAQASCTLSSTKINLTWTAADATQREIWALVLASNLTGSYSACGVNPQGSITVLKQCTPIAGGETDFPFGATGGLSPSSFTLLDGESQLFANVSPGTYGITESAPDGWTATYDVSNDDPHDAIVLSGTEAITVTVTNTFQSSETEQILRRLRRWALPWDGNKKIFIPRIEIIAQMGVGNSDDPDPVMSLRISPDGGETWGPYREMPLGASGDTMIRAYLTRFCQGLRNPVAELICDAPVFVAWVACELPQDFTVGTS